MHLVSSPWLTAHTPNAAVLSQLLQLHSAVREMGGEERREEMDQQIPSHHLCYKSHVPYMDMQKSLCLWRSG